MKAMWNPSRKQRVATRNIATEDLPRTTRSPPSGQTGSILMSQTRFDCLVRQTLVIGFALGLLLLGIAGQQRVSAQASSRERELEPEPTVSLSAATIIDILRREPGLLLEVKRVLVRKAYEQGRLLDPVDLSDDAVFQLLQDDENVRVLATEEIEKRGYVRAKPTRKEMQKDGIERVPSAESAAAAGSAPVPRKASESQ